MLRLATLVVCLLSSVAHAEDDAPDPIPLSFGLPQVGIGWVSRGATDDMELAKTELDGTLRWSPAKAVKRDLRVGGFVEVRTAGFDTFEVGIGPHVMYSLSELWAVQLRTGVAAVGDGPNYGLVGIQIGNPFVGVTATARRFFDDDHMELSVNLELTTGLLLVPFIRVPGP